MNDLDTALTKQSWRRIKRVTGIVTAASVAISVIVTNIIMEVFSAGVNVQGLSVAIVMPLLMGTPMVFFMSLRHEQMRCLNQKLNILATTDWLTNCLNRGTFTLRATQMLERTLPTAASNTCALLIIDADGFKSVNDRFGHQNGDLALQMIADAIRAHVRSTDLVGRLGGEEFGVYLDDASPAIADQVAERIRLGVAELEFIPNAQHCPLSVSIGGASFSKPVEFEQLYRLADQHLYDAKQSGRDRVTMMRAA